MNKRTGWQDSTIIYDLPPWEDNFLSSKWSYEVNFDISIVAAEVEANHQNPFGAVTGEYLKLPGRLICCSTVMLQHIAQGILEHGAYLDILGPFATVNREYDLDER